MKFLIDAQLPFLLVQILEQAGFKAVHTSELPSKNASTDTEVIAYAQANNLTIISKDVDFLNSYLIKKEPEKLLLVSTGNIKNKELLSLFRQNINTIVRLLEQHDVLELSRDTVVVHY